MSETASMSLKSRINDVRDLHRFCLTYEHGIRSAGVPYQKRQDAGEFISRRASTFVYAFFVFNQLYSINWVESLAHPDREPAEHERTSQQRQFWLMMETCYQSECMDAPALFSSYLRQYCRHFGINKPHEKLKAIRSEDNIDLETKLKNQYDERQNHGKELTMQSVADFKQSFRLLFRYGEKQSDIRLSIEEHQKYLNNVLYFVYCVRCNVFHGRKNVAVAYIHRSQDIRLLIYSALLLAASQVVLENAHLEIVTRNF